MKSTSHDEEEALRRLVFELRVLEGTAESVRTRIGLAEAALNELRSANAALEGLKGEKGNSPLLVPIGGGSYVKARIQDSKRVIAGIGAGVATEKRVDEAQESIEGRMAELERIRTSLRQQFDQLMARISDTRDKIQAMTQKPSEGRSGV